MDARLAGAAAVLLFWMGAALGQGFVELGLLGRQRLGFHDLVGTVSGDEVMRVVQRRLFAELGDDGVHRTVARAYADLVRPELET